MQVIQKYLFLTTFATPDKTVAQQVLFGVPQS